VKDVIIKEKEVLKYVLYKGYTLSGNFQMRKQHVCDG
jgi:hypothetical protein